MRFITVGAVLIGASAIAATSLSPATAQQAQTTVEANANVSTEAKIKTPKLRCDGKYVKQKRFAWYVSRVYRRNKISKVALKKISRMRYCAYTKKASINMRSRHRLESKKRKARKLARLIRRRASRSFPVRAHLQSIARCESGGNIRAISPGGQYRGKYQFSFSTWASVGGSGDPAAASEYEQDKRAEMLYKRSGPGQWPVCQGR